MHVCVCACACVGQTLLPDARGFPGAKTCRRRYRAPAVRVVHSACIGAPALCRTSATATATARRCTGHAAALARRSPPPRPEVVAE